MEYPAPYEHANLDKIASLKARYPECIIGYSDHTLLDPSCEVLKTAYTLGALVIEKHFTLDKSITGNDHEHAMDAADIKRILQELSFVCTLRGSGRLESLESEANTRLNARRSIVSAAFIPKGTALSRENLTFKRPGTGLSPDKLEGIIGKTAAVDIPGDTILTSALFS
jgi:N-acetylneuraminate synthase